MKELKDTVELMLSDNWQDRLKAEIYQCQIRREKLAYVVYSMSNDDPQYEILHSQLVHMIDYECDLTNRASAFGIELESIEQKDPDKKFDEFLNNCCCDPTRSPCFDYGAFLLGAIFGMDLNKDGDKK